MKAVTRYPVSLLFFTCAALVALTGFCLAGEVASPQMTTLPNGLRLIVKSDPGQGIVALNIVVRAGSANETAAESGAAHLLEHMLFCGSKGYGPGAAEELIEGLGGTVNAGTLRDYTHVYATVPVEALEPTIKALASAMLTPTLEPVELERERGIILSEMARTTEDPSVEIWDFAHRALFAGQPYGRPIDGNKDSVMDLSRELLVAFHHRWYVPNNMAVVLVGDVSLSQALALTKSYFGQLNPGAASLPISTPAASPQQEQNYRHDGSLSYVALTATAPAVSNPRDIYALDVLSALLSDGNKAWLKVALQQKDALALNCGAEFLTSRQPSPFMIWAVCPPEKTAAVRVAIESLLTNVANGAVTPTELTVAQRRLETSFWLANETYAEQADVLGFYEAIDNYRFATTYVSRIRAVTPAQLSEVVKKYFASEKRVWVLLQPHEKKKPADPGLTEARAPIAD